MFIVNEDDITARPDFVDEVCQNIEDTGIARVPNKIKESIKTGAGNAHWYTVAIQRRNGANPICYIMDTQGKNQVSNDELFTRNKFLCEKILNGHSTVDYKDKVKQKIVDIIRANAIDE